MSRKRKIDKNAKNVELRYSNWFSQLVAMIQTTFLWVIGGRGTSKSEDILAERTMDIAYDMPGAFVALSSDTFMNATKNILPSIINGWRRKGWIEGIHYVVDVRPPKHFKQPYKPILNWKHTVTVFTGTHFKIISQDRPSIGAGDSFQHHIGDEAKYLNIKKLNKVNPAIRGEFVRFGKSPFYGGSTFTTDMPNVNQGEHDWILDMAGSMDKDKILKLVELAMTVNEIRIEYVNAKNDSENNPQDTGLNRELKNKESLLKRWEERFRKFRMNTSFFYVVSSFVNADILTQGYFKKLLETMDFKEFMVSILSISPTLEKGLMFYPNLSHRNFYSDGFTYTRRDEFKTTDEYEETSLDLKYIHHNGHLEGGLDTGNMCSLVIGQEQAKIYRGLKEFYTIPPDFLPELGKQFRDYFKYHKRKELQLWPDRAAHKNKSVGEDHASKFKKAVEYDEEGNRTPWTVTIMNPNQGNITQQQEFELCLDMMSGRNPNLPFLMIDRNTCPCWKSSMERAEKIIREDKNGSKTIHKNKSSEKLPPAQLPMKSTNMSDAGKYLLCRPEYLDETKGDKILMTSNPTTH
jgi:hypothetical protein